MKQIRSIVALLAIVLLIFSGCSTDKMQETMKELDRYNIETTKNNHYEVEITEFDLGKKEYVSKASKIMPYHIKGIIGVPKGEGPFPLVLITHGSHSNDDESKRFDTGFDYLVEDLAKNGYVAVSMDMSKPYIWKYGDNDDHEKSLPVANDHIKNLMLANEGNNPGYTIDLKGRVNFDQLALIGHSKGGETIFDIAIDQASRGIDIKSMLSIAPTFFFDREWPKGDIAVIVPEYDGDVMGLDGFNTYRALNEKGKSFHSVTHLMKGNHNYFNRNIERNDALMVKTEIEAEDQLTREQQEHFITNFAVDFFNASLLGKKDSFLTAKNPQPNKMYGLDVKTMYRSNEAVDLVDIKTIDNFNAQGASLEAKIDSWFYKYDQVLIDTVTGGEDPYMTRSLINIKWEHRDSEVVISPNIADFSQFNGLTLNMVIDSADELNKKDAAQQFTVELRDAAGNISRIILPENLNALGYTPGKIDFTPLDDFNIYYWSTMTPISCINLPLSEFQNIDLEHIESISLIFDKTNSGSIYVDSIYLQ